jgi:hypothetical protein
MKAFCGLGHPHPAGTVWALSRVNTDPYAKSFRAVMAPSFNMKTNGFGRTRTRRTCKDLSTQHQDLCVSEFDTDETRRARRARLIKETNRWSQDALDLDVIVRKRDPKDRRRALYFIHPLLEASLEPSRPA